MPQDGPKFPAIAVCPRDSFSVVQAMAGLEAASPRGLESGYFERLYIVDSNGDRWRVARVETTSARPKGPFGKLIGVQLFLSPPDRPLLAEVADDLCQLVDADRDDLYDQFVTHEELKLLFRSAPTIERLIAVAANLGEDP